MPLSDAGQVRRTLEGKIPEKTSGNNVGHSVVIYRDWEARMAILRRYDHEHMALNVVRKSSVLGLWKKEAFQLNSEDLEMAKLGLD